MFKRKKKETPEQGQQEDTVDSILSKIKNVVSGKENVKIEDDVTLKRKPVKGQVDEEPLELTEMVGGDEEESENPETDESSVLEDILKNLSTVEDKKNETSEEVVQESAVIEGQDFAAEAEVVAQEDEFVDVLKQIDDEFEKNNVQNKEVDNQQIPIEVVAEEVTVTQSVAENTNFDLEAELEKNNLEQENVVDNITPLTEEKAVEEIAPAVSETVKEVKAEIETKPIKQMATDNEQEKQNLVSNEVASKSSASIKQLIESIPKPKIDSPHFASGSTLEDLVLQSLKPMLGEWLDKNLDLIVRDIVSKEIRKLIPRE